MHTQRLGLAALRMPNPSGDHVDFYPVKQDGAFSGRTLRDLAQFRRVRLTLSGCNHRAKDHRLSQWRREITPSCRLIPGFHRTASLRETKMLVGQQQARQAKVHQTPLAMFYDPQVQDRRGDMSPMHVIFSAAIRGHMVR
jgi:hypothetical protein